MVVSKCVQCRLGVDLDGVIIRSNLPQFKQWINDHDKNPTSYENFGQLPEETASDLYCQFLSSPAAPPMQIMPGALEALRALSQFASFYLITARGLVSRALTLNALQPLIPTDVRFTDMIFGCARQKDAAMSAYGIRLLVDDSPPELKRVVGARQDNYGIGMFNPDILAWPQHERIILPSTIRRFYSPSNPRAQDALYRATWIEIVETITNLYAQGALSIAA